MPPPSHDPYAAFRFPDYRNYWIGGFISVIGRQMVAVAIGYEIFQRTHSATALGLMGLAGALPVILLSLPAGQVADRFRRKRILIVTQLILVASSAALVALSLNYSAVPDLPALAWINRGIAWLAALFGEKTGVSFQPALPFFYGLLLLNGVARAFGWSARSPFVANLVPRTALASAVTWGSTNFEVGSVVGPAIGGLVIAQFGFSIVYALDAVCGLVFIGFLLPIADHQERIEPGLIRRHPLRELFAGLGFVFRKKVILASITLDLFAVLLGGATALLPMLADQVLHVGAVGLGWLRAAPSFGALAMALTIAHRPPMRRPGITLLWAVGGFGLATVLFGLSRSFWFSLSMLALTGALDNISVVVRHTLVQLLTPDSMRGRVSAVNNIFIGSSNELGALESGLTAALFGPALAIVAGGMGTILVVLGAAWCWPELRRIGALHLITQEPEDRQADAAAGGVPP
ncbi:MAG: major facilitator superfamily 1 [Chthoniobacteraceae bacterium]|nr:major facilitator superfamily 1 [Chthoniobacteraceae bacterium]